ncbi:abortive phage resistance protein [Lonepinella koalarum]|uniref:Abortive infection bacteriophage resistance protein n=1 Tax=Lonepinella koalarum TaxID=53417 RepID=A0A4R1L4A1_9PAST|nr:Abi family protein [Lonepinella koalarum]MDH2925887.1 abortive phage resistance protein [Lonepinella koalarum]TCK71039.1 abortive infection bacteriophage resistance protein [Lonepinella koalarum]TFJ90771.1 abortive phage resistance protein [Lonepinella koalarum]TYG34554.1 abortive phage resistance protein [Lonepinella koalarum]
MTYPPQHFLKQWQDYDDLLQLLKQRHMQISDDNKAKQYLERIGYYRLSGYWYPFREINFDESNKQHKLVLKDSFKANTVFAQIIQLYVFDKKLRLLALDALERIEMAVRNDVVYLLGKQNPLAYQQAECLHGNFSKRLAKNKDKTAHQIWLEKLQAHIGRSHKHPAICHYREKYQGQLPIWVVAEVWDFGLLSHLFAGMKKQDQDIIAGKYGTTAKTLEKWLKSLNFIRNIAAHHARLWNVNILELSPTPPQWQNIPNEKPFLYFCIMQLLLNKICPNSTWSERFTALMADFPTLSNQAISLHAFGLLENWQDLAIWKKENQHVQQNC